MDKKFLELNVKNGINKLFNPKAKVTMINNPQGLWVLDSVIFQITNKGKVISFWDSKVKPRLDGRGKFIVVPKKMKKLIQDLVTMRKIKLKEVKL